MCKDPILSREAMSLQCARGSDGRLPVVLDFASVATASLDGLDNLHGFLVCDLSKDNVLAIQPVSRDGSNEELGTVTG